MDMQTCTRCDGTGIDPVPAPVCCRRAMDECGGRGCSGPEPEQQPCADCGGYGRFPDAPTEADGRADPERRGK